MVRVCDYWLAGRCTYGDRCRFAHYEPDVYEAPPRQPRFPPRYPEAAPPRQVGSGRSVFSRLGQEAHPRPAPLIPLRQPLLSNVPFSFAPPSRIVQPRQPLLSNVPFSFAPPSRIVQPGQPLLPRPRSPPPAQANPYKWVAPQLSSPPPPDKPTLPNFSFKEDRHKMTVTVPSFSFKKDSRRSVESWAEEPGTNWSNPRPLSPIPNPKSHSSQKGGGKAGTYSLVSDLSEEELNQFQSHHFSDLSLIPLKPPPQCAC